jgi:tetratricopeptide (TPR) repeat protein
VTLKPINPGEGSKPGTVSVAELKEKVPDKARKEFEKASIAGSQGRTDEAISHLQKAISIFPSFIRAHNDLGTYFLSQGKLDKAEEAFRKAIALDANAFNPLLNLGIVLVHKQAFAEAADQLTKALSLEPNSSAAHLYSGLAFMGTNNLDSAERELKACYSLGGQKFGVALYHLGTVYMNRGDRAAALKSFEQYLTVVPDARNAQQVQKLIAMLRP